MVPTIALAAVLSLGWLLALGAWTQWEAAILIPPLSAFLTAIGLRRAQVASP